MRRIIVLAVLSAATIGSGQYLETVIELRENCDPVALCMDATRSKLYVASDDDSVLFVLDAETLEKLDSIDCRDELHGLVLNPDANKVYAWVLDWGVVQVADCATDSIVAELQLRDDSWGALSYCPGFGKLYTSHDNMVRVFDGHGDTLIADVPPYGAEDEMCVNSAMGKVYVAASRDSGRCLNVYDCRLDTLVEQVDVLGGAVKLCWNRVESKIYALACESGGTWGIEVIDCRADTLLRLVSLSRCPQDAMLNPVENTLYVQPRSLSGDSVVWVVDCSGDSLLREVELGWPGRLLAVDTLRNRVYASGRWGRVLVLDGRTDSVVADIELPTGNAARPALFDPGRGRVLVAAGDGIAVIRDTTTGAEEPETEPPVAEALQPAIMRASELARLDCRVLDIQGRDVTDRRDRLAPGIYFLRSAVGREPSAVQKVIVR